MGNYYQRSVYYLFCIMSINQAKVAEAANIVVDAGKEVLGLFGRKASVEKETAKVTTRGDISHRSQGGPLPHAVRRSSSTAGRALSMEEVIDAKYTRDRLSGSIRVSGSFREDTLVTDTLVTETDVVVEEVVVVETDLVETDLVKTEQTDRVVVVPTKDIVDEVQEITVDCKQKIIEVERKIEIIEVVEVPEVEIIDVIEEQEVKHQVYRTIEIPVVEEVEVIREVPVEQIEERFVEVENVEYIDNTIEKVVEVPTIKERVHTKEVIIPVYQEEINYIENVKTKNRKVHRKVPVPIEVHIEQNFQVPGLRKKYKTRTYDAMLPEFQEYAVHKSAISTEGAVLLNNIHDTLAQPSVGLCHAEGLFHDARKHEFLQEPCFVTQGMIMRDVMLHVPHLANIHDVHIGEVTTEDVSCSVRSKGATSIQLQSRGKSTVGRKDRVCC